MDNSEGIMEGGELRQLLARRLRRVAEGVIRDACIVDLGPACAMWQEAPMVLQPGDRVTGMMLRPASLGMPVTPRGPNALWMRIGREGVIVGGTGSTHSFIACKCGSLELAGTRSGKPVEAHRDATLAEHLAVVLRWNTTPLRGLRHLANVGDMQGLVRIEIDRLCQIVEDVSRSRPLTGSRRYRRT